MNAQEMDGEGARRLEERRKRYGLYEGCGVEVVVPGTQAASGRLLTPSTICAKEPLARSAAECIQVQFKDEPKQSVEVRV